MIDPKQIEEWVRMIHADRQSDVLRAEREEMLALLRECETGTEDMCPICNTTLHRPTADGAAHGDTPFGEHEPGCRLAALIGRK